LKPVVRIQGLVRLANHVRKEIGRGVTAEQRQALRRAVERAVGQVDAILKERGVRAGRLAAPSRGAYQFLKDIRWEAVPQAEATSATSQEQHTVRLPGLGPLMERIVRRLATPIEPAELAEIGRAIEQASRRAEQAIRREGITPEQLTPVSRDQRGWFAWLSEGENLRRYVAAVELARRALEAAQPRDRVGGGRTFVIEFRPLRHIYKMRTRGGVSTVQLPTPMVRFDPDGFAELTRLIFSHEREAKGRVVERMRGEAYVDAMTEIEALGGVTDSTRGAYFDLGDSFDRVNARYFGGEMKRPRLTWSRSFTRRKFGHYDHVKDWVMVSSTLDQPQVPEFVVDFLMYHELLHKKHGIYWVNGRGLAHTKAFYADERRFERFDEAEEWLKRLARGH
jgi:hypothetical protein